MRHFAGLACVSLGLLAWSATAASAQWRGRDGIDRTARQVTHRARQLHHVIHRHWRGNPLAHAVRHFIGAAERFEQFVERGRRHGPIEREFSHLQRAYVQLRAAFHQAHDIHHNRYVVRDWERLTSTFEQLRMEAHDDGRHHHRHRPHDRQYDRHRSDRTPWWFDQFVRPHIERR